LVCFIGGGVPQLAHIRDVGQQDVGSIPTQRAAPAQRAGPGTGVVAGDVQAGGPNRLAVVGSIRPSAVTPPPVRLTMPRLHVDAAVLPVSVGLDGLLGVPDNPLQLGWWSGSSKPGMPSGSVVIDGHVDSATFGVGALFRLRDARPGDDVVVTNAAGVTIRYSVVARRTYDKTTLPVTELFAADVDPRLVLLTCGGPFDRTTRHYADNVVVYAVPR
jgi:hypothetical protein